MKKELDITIITQVKKGQKASNYDLIVNTSNASLDKIADAIIEYINKVQE